MVSQTKKKYLYKGCIIKNKLSKNIYIKERIGTDSVDAEVYKVCQPFNCKYKFALKKIPLFNNDYKYIKNNTSVNAILKSEVWREVYFYKLTSQLATLNICPHVPIMLKYFLCNKKCTFTNKNILSYSKNLNETPQNCLSVILPLEDNVFSNFLRKKNISLNYILIAYFQIYMGIYCVQKYYDIIHHDLHYDNVLYHETKIGEPNERYEYIINNKSYLIPNIGFTFIINDFGRSFIEKKDSIKIEDYKHITSMLKHIRRVKYKKLCNVLMNLINKSNNSIHFIESIAKLLHDIYYIEKPIIIATYNTDLILN